MKKLRWKTLLRMGEIPAMLLLIQLGLGGWEKRGWPIPVSPVPNQRWRDLPRHGPEHTQLYRHPGL